MLASFLKTMLATFPADCAESGMTFRALLAAFSLVAHSVFAVSSGTVRPISPATNDGIGGIITAQGHGTVVYNGTHYFCFFQQSTGPGSFVQDVRVARVNRNGTVLDSSPEIVGGTVAAATPVNAAAASNGVVLVVWEDTRNAGNGRDVYGALVGADGKRIGPSGGFPIARRTGNQSIPNVSFSGSQFLVAWTSGDTIEGRRITMDGTLLDGADDAPALVLTADASSVGEPALAPDSSGNWLLAWDGFLVGNIQCRRISSSGVLLGAGPTAINSLNTGIIPAVAWNGSQWLVTWGDNRGTSSSNIQHIRGARVNADATLADPLGGFEIAANPNGDEDQSAIAAAGSDWLVVWNEKTLVNNSLSIRFGARVVKADGMIEGTVADRGITTITTGQFGPRCASDGVSWLVTATAVNTSVVPVGRAYIVRVGDNRTEQTINIPAIADRFLNDGSFFVSLPTQTSAGLPVVIENLTPDVIGLQNGVITPLTQGTASIRVSNAGDTNRLPVTVTQSFEILGNRQTLTLPVIPLFVSLGDVVDLSGAMSDSMLPVSVELVSGAAMLTETSLTISGSGPIVIRFTQVGNDTFAPVTVERTLYNDSARPSVRIINPSFQQVIVTPNFQINGGAGDDVAVAFVQIRLNTGLWQNATLSSAQTFQPSVNWSFAADTTLGLVTGPNLIEVRAVDLAGQASRVARRSFFFDPVDTVAPSLTVATPSQATPPPVFSGLVQAVVTGTASDDTALARVRVRLNGVAWFDASGTANWSAPLDPSRGLRAGNNLVEVQALDTAGNGSAIVSRAFKFSFQSADDKVLPTVAITQPTDAAQGGASFSVSGIAADAGSVTRVEYRMNLGSWLGVDTLQGTTAATWQVASIPNPGGTIDFEVRAFDTAGNVSRIARKRFSRSGTQPITIRTFLGGMQSTDGGVVGKITSGSQQTLSRALKLTATPKVGFVFEKWRLLRGMAVIGESRIPALSVVMQDGLIVEAYFAASVFEPDGAGYGGNFGNGTHDGSGTVSVLTTKTGTFSGTLLFGGGLYRFKGKLDFSGSSVFALKRSRATPLELRFLADSGNSGGRLVGSVDDGVDTHGFSVPRYSAFSKTAPASQVGLHTFALSPSIISAEFPSGHSTGTFTVTAMGQVSVKGKLADGSAWSAGSSLAVDGTVSFGANLYKGLGQVLSTFEFSQITSGALLGRSEGVGTGLWVKKATTTGNVLEAFALELDTLSSAYVVQKGRDPFELGQSSLAIILRRLNASGGIAQSWNATLQPSGAVGPLSPTTESPSLKLTPSSGDFGGKFAPVGALRAISFGGVILQSRGRAVGAYVPSVGEVHAVEIVLP